jgi:5-formyltetrahydrofolate cyclo-ligase
MLQTKKLTRAEALARRDALSDVLRAEKSVAIARSFLGCAPFQKARCVFIYVSVRSEVDTRLILNSALEQQKKVCVPLIDMQKKEMSAREIHDPARDLHPGILGIPEPDRETSEAILWGEIDLAIIPGLAFTEQGHRIGYGGGFYDRFLSAFAGEALALAFEEQIVAKLPCGPHDAAVHSIITEKRVIFP